MKLLIFSILITTRISFHFASSLHTPYRCYASDVVCTTIKARDLTPGLLQTLPDPLSYDSLVIKEEGLQFQLNGVNIYGLNGLYVDHFGIDPISNMTRAIFHMNILATSRYKTNGTMFNKPIYGHGDMLADIKNVEFETIGEFDVVKGDDGLEYVNAIDYQFRYDVRGNLKLKLSNLYDGNKELSHYMHYLFDQNWKVMTELYARAFFRRITDKLFYASRTYLHSVPLEYLIVR